MGNAAPEKDIQSVNSMVDRLQASSQDFEWYPTTDEMLECVRSHIQQNQFCKDKMPSVSVLDCGAGDGRALYYLTKGERYAIEKSRPLLDQLDRSVFVVGTDFHAQALIDKRVSVVFSNPPYSEYRDWVLKLIKEANSKGLYLVIPQRWREDHEIARAIEARNAKVESLALMDFEDGPRKARSRIEVVHVSLSRQRDPFSSRVGGPDVDPFELWFDEFFPLNLNQSKRSDHEIHRAEQSRMKDELEENIGLIESRGLVSVLEELYQRDMDHLIENYRRLCDLDSELLRELDVSVEGVRAALKLIPRRLPTHLNRSDRVPGHLSR